MPSDIYKGVWINWSHGPIAGSTLTLGEREGGFLIAFVAFFVTLVGAQLFKIFSYLFHQIRSRSTAQDGLHHQQQVIFRNAASPFSAAWNFLQQSWAWNKKARSSFVRTIPWALFCLCYMALFALAAVFSSQITKSAGSARLVVGENCGYWTTDENATAAANNKAFLGRQGNLTLANAAYVRECYGGSSQALNCGRMPKAAITTSNDANATCPFADGMCELGATAAFEIKSERMDSLYDLGINSRHSQRVQFQKITTCSPIIKEGFVEAVPGNPAIGMGMPTDMLYYYNYGPSVYSGGAANITNYTEVYNNHTMIDVVGYKLSSTYWAAGQGNFISGYQPVPELNQSYADLTMLFLSQNTISYAAPVEDPMFSAHGERDLSSIVAGVMYYTADYFVNVMGCVDQYQVCNPINDVCTGQMGNYQLIPWIVENKDKIDFNPMQRAIAARIISHSFNSGVWSNAAISAEGGLLARDQLMDQLSQALPVNQWQLEVTNFFNKGLASIQLAILEYAEGPPVGPGATLLQPWITTPNPDPRINDIAKDMCKMQLINDSTDSVSFSIIGLIVVFVIGGAIVFISVILDTTIGWIQRKFNIGTHARMSWLLDDKLQLHKYLNHELGQGQWNHEQEGFPITVTPQEFNSLVASRQRRTNTIKTTDRPSSEDASAPAYQGPGFSGRGYTQVTTTEEHWHEK